MDYHLEEFLFRVELKQCLEPGFYSAHPLTDHPYCVFQPANGCSTHRSLVEIDFLMLKQLVPSLTQQNKQLIEFPFNSEIT